MVVSTFFSLSCIVSLCLVGSRQPRLTTVDVNTHARCKNTVQVVNFVSTDTSGNLPHTVLPAGYEKYNQMRQDSAFCFLERCGPPDGAALLAEQLADTDDK